MGFQSVSCAVGKTVDKPARVSLFEHLIVALDKNDREQLTDIISTLQITAITHGLTEIVSLSLTLNEKAENGSDRIELRHIAGQLLDLCRSPQSTLLQAANETPEHLPAIRCWTTLHESVAFHPTVP